MTARAATIAVIPDAMSPATTTSLTIQWACLGSDVPFVSSMEVVLCRYCGP